MGQTVFQVIDNVGGLRLSDTAKRLLQAKRYDDFIAQYGKCFVWKTTYGGSFFGSASFRVKHALNTQDLSVAASIDMNRFPMSGEAAADFSREVEEKMSSLEFKMFWQCTGFPCTPPKSKDGDAANMLRLEQAYQEWDSGSAHGIGRVTKLYPRSWTMIEEVQAAVLEADVETQKKFRCEPPSDFIRGLLAEEYYQAGSLRKSVEQTLEWECIKDVGSAGSAMRLLNMDIRKHVDAMDTMNDATWGVLVAQIQQNDYSFFAATDQGFGSAFQSRYLKTLGDASCRIPVRTAMTHLAWPGQSSFIRFDGRKDGDNTVFAAAISIRTRGTCMQKCDEDGPVADGMALTGFTVGGQIIVKEDQPAQSTAFNANEFPKSTVTEIKCVARTYMTGVAVQWSGTCYTHCHKKIFRRLTLQCDPLPSGTYRERPSKNSFVQVEIDNDSYGMHGCPAGYFVTAMEAITSDICRDNVCGNDDATPLAKLRLTCRAASDFMTA